MDSRHLLYLLFFLTFQLAFPRAEGRAELIPVGGTLEIAIEHGRPNLLLEFDTANPIGEVDVSYRGPFNFVIGTATFDLDGRLFGQPSVHFELVDENGDLFSVNSWLLPDPVIPIPFENSAGQTQISIGYQHTIDLVPGPPVINEQDWWTDTFTLTADRVAGDVILDVVGRDPVQMSRRLLPLGGADLLRVTNSTSAPIDALFVPEPSAGALSIILLAFFFTAQSISLAVAATSTSQVRMPLMSLLTATLLTGLDTHINTDRSDKQEEQPKQLVDLAIEAMTAASLSCTR